MKMDLALNNLQRLICYKNQPTKQTINLTMKEACAPILLVVDSYVHLKIELD